MGAVGILGVEGDPADRLYLAVLAVAVVGSVVARRRAAGMARTMVVTAAAVCLVGVAALCAGPGWLFRSAARSHPLSDGHEPVSQR